MFNVTVLRMKDILKVLIGFTLTLLIIVVLSKSFYKNTKEEKVAEKIETGITKLSQKSMLSCLDQTIPSIATIHEKDKTIADKEESGDILQVILKTQISAIKGMEEIETKETKETAENTNEKVEENQETEVAQTGMQTQVITNNPISENANCQYGKVKIKNQTDYTLTEEMLTPDITIENKNIVLFHTHSCESYTSSEKYPYTPTGTFRTTDLNFTVTRVGTELENQLKQYSYNVIHNTDYHDYPSYNGSYTRSLATVENILQNNPSDIIIDVHRDAIGSRSDYAPTVKIGDTDEAAQIMFVIRNQ